MASKKVAVKPEQLSKWEAGSERPSIPQLRRLASAYRRPLASFYLPEPPTRFEVMHDFRRGADKFPPRENQPELALEIRRAYDRREWALELMQEIDESPPAFSLKLKAGEEVERAAARVREALRISLDAQRSWTTDSDAFRNWRFHFERAGILTFQTTEIALEEVRGFSISLSPLPAAVTNIKDAPRGRIFTLLHEAVHIGLSESGICDMHDADVEAYCNRVAGAALFPKDALLASQTIRTHGMGNPAWTDRELRDLSRQFGGSREAALVRLLTLGMTTQKFYEHRKEEFVQEYRRQREERKEGFAPPHVVALSSAGPLFTSLVVENFNRERITASDVSDYLQIRLKHLSNLQSDFAWSA